MKRPFGTWGIFMAVTLIWACLTGTSWGGDFTEEQHNQLDKCEWNSPAGGKLPYRLYDPTKAKGSKGNKRRKYPLILFLHGSGERGTNNTAQLFQDHVLHLIFSEEGKKHPAFLVAPQCPNGHKWQEADIMRQVKELLTELKKKHPIDPKKVYLTGMSMGGGGAFHYLIEMPEEWAAVVPVCGYADNAKLASVEAVRKVPIWIFHGDKDQNVRTENSRSAYKVLQDVNANVQYTEFPGVAHNSWINAYRSEDLAKWLFQQKQGAKSKATKSQRKNKSEQKRAKR